MLTIRRALRSILALVVLTGAFLILGAPSAYAAAVSASAVVGVPAVAIALDLPQLLNLFLAVVFPILVGVITKKVTSSRAKAIWLASISLASGIVSQLLFAVTGGVPFDLIGAVLTGGAAWLIGIATYEGFWKPTGAAAYVQDNVGVGAAEPRVDGAHNEKG